MKNIFDIMKEYGMEVPEEKHKDFEKAVLENYKTVTDYDNQTEKLNKANETIKANDAAMEDLKKELEGFKDVDVTALNQRITDLETEKASIKKEYENKIADRDFNDILKDSIAAVKGRNAKAIMALLDTDTLKTSEEERQMASFTALTFSGAKPKLLFCSLVKRSTCSIGEISKDDSIQ